MRRLALVAVLLAVFLPAAAGDPDYYQRTGTKPPIQGDFLLGPKLHWGDQFGLGVQGAYLDQTHGIAYTLSLDAVRIDGLSGTTDFKHRCKNLKVPVNVDSRVRGVVAFGVMFTLR